MNDGQFLWQLFHVMKMDGQKGETGKGTVALINEKGGTKRDIISVCYYGLDQEEPEVAIHPI
jgi:hypothetical protein